MENNVHLVYIDMGLKPLIPKFLAYLDVESGKLLAAFKDGHVKDIQFTAHRLKGSCGGYGFTELGQVALQIEEAIGENKSAVVGELIYKMRSLIENLEIEYRK